MPRPTRIHAVDAWYHVTARGTEWRPVFRDDDDRPQAATASGKPVFLRVDYESGHGVGTTKKQSEEQAGDMWTFLLWQLGLPGFQPSRSD